MSRLHHLINGAVGLLLLVATQVLSANDIRVNRAMPRASIDIAKPYEFVEAVYDFVQRSGARSS